MGYAGLFYNANNAASGPGLAVKVASASAAALDVSQGSSATTAGTSLLRVNGSGYVGIGTSTPSARLTVQPATDADQGLRVSDGSNGNMGLQTLTGANSGFSFLGFNGAYNGGEVRFNPNKNRWRLGTDQRGGSDVLFLDTYNGTTGTTIFTALANGNLGVGNTNPGYKLDVSGDINASGSVRSGGNVITSDARFKQQVRPLGGALASVLALRGVRYTWNALGVKHGGKAGAEQVGVLAQEVEKIYPELVSTGPDGYKAVNYAQLTPVLIEALKEQQAQIEALKAEAAIAKAAAAQATADLLTMKAQLARLLGEQPPATRPAPARK